MLHIRPFHENWRSDTELHAMFVARKHVFVDLLGWDLQVLDDIFEVDEFDRPGAIYLIVTGEDGTHEASTRLLPTVRPHLLDTLFASLCTTPAPRGRAVREITRFCLDQRQRAAQRRQARDELVHGLARYALDQHVATYTGVAEIPWFEQIMAFGWDCRALGAPRAHKGQQLTALRIDIAQDTPLRLARAGIRPAEDQGESRHAA